MASFFQSITAYFAPTRREGPHAGTPRQALSYAHDAFSLPTHSPTTSQLDNLPHSRSHSAFSYPPATPGTTLDDAFTPSSSSDRLNRSSQGNSLLPMYQPRSASLNHPSLDKTWSRIRTWLANEYPELGDTLNYGILPEALAEIELNLGAQLPRAVRESYLAVDGQEAESSAGCSEGLFFGLTFLPLETVLEEWRFWREVDDDPATGANPQLRESMQSVPEGWIRREYSCRGWIPLVTDKAGNYIGVDLRPPPRPMNPDGSSGPGGSPGQVIIFGRDFDTKIVLWRGDGESGWAKWLASFVEELESGEGFEVRGTDNDKDGTDSDSEDSVGYEGYYFSGNGGGKGGDAGSGGSMRFTGEYKGWNAIEVWADRSYKRWYTAGLIKDEELVLKEPVSTPAGGASTPALITDITPASGIDNNTLDSAAPTALVAPPPRSSSGAAPPTAPSTSDASTLSSNTSQSPLLPAPVPKPTRIDSKEGSDDLLSLTSSGPSSWTTIEASSSGPVTESSTSAPIPNEPLAPLIASPPPTLVDSLEVKSAQEISVPPVPAELEVSAKEDLDDALPPDTHTIRLVSGPATLMGPASESEAPEESHELELVPGEPHISTSRPGSAGNDAKRKGFGALSKLGVGGKKRKDTVS